MVFEADFCFLLLSPFSVSLLRECFFAPFFELFAFSGSESFDAIDVFFLLFDDFDFEDRLLECLERERSGSRMRV